MKIRVKMLGDLRQYLPANSGFNECELTVADDAGLPVLLGRIAVPESKAFLLMRNGDMIPEGDYANTELQDDDEVVLFPPIKGG